LTGIEAGMKRLSRQRGRDVRPVWVWNTLPKRMRPSTNPGQHAAQVFAAEIGTEIQPGATLTILDQEFTVAVSWTALPISWSTMLR